MNQILSWGRTIAGTALLLLLPVLAAAQGDGRFTGAVLDPSGAVVAGATVTVKNERTGVVRTATTDVAGRFVIVFSAGFD